MRKELFGAAILLAFGAGNASAQMPSEILGPADFMRTGTFVGGPPSAELQAANGPAGNCCECVCKSRLYVDAAYLIMGFQRTNPPPLIAAGPVGAIGVAGVPGTTILFGGGDHDFGGFNAARLTIGYWLDSKQTWGVEVGGLATEQRDDQFVVTHNGAPTNTVALGRVNFALAGLGLGPVVGLPGVLRGTETVTQESRLWTAETNIVLNWREQCRTRIDLLAGFRYMDLEESLTVRDDTQSVLVPTTAISRTDDFSTRNQFYGAQVGSRVVYSLDRVSLTLVGKLALGDAHQTVERNGATQIGGTTVAGGYLVPAGNVAQDTTDRFALMSETTIQLGYKLTQRLEAYIGYELLYLSSVARPADQIFTTGSAIGPLSNRIDVTDFFAQGVQLGMTFKW